MSGSFALVLGAGGVSGVSWTLGLLAGLSRAGAFDVGSAARIVGTSAGAVVGAAVASGQRLEDLVDSVISAPSSGRTDFFAGVDPALAAEIFGCWSSAPLMTADVARHIGALAVRAAPQDPEEWVRRTALEMPEYLWVEDRLRVVTVEASSGARVSWSASDGVALPRVVAASSAVPGIIPPVLIGDSRYLDGGVWSSTNADLVLEDGLDRVLITCPQARLAALSTCSLRALEHEMNLLQDRGLKVEVVTPGPAYDELGFSHMSSKVRLPALEAGLADAASAAARVKAFL